MTSRFPFGKAPLIMLVLAAISGLFLIRTPKKQRATLTFWTFARPHYLSYQEALPEFLRKHPRITIDMQLVHYSVVHQRLQASFMAGVDVPDLVEVEITQVGRFFRGPLKDIGFVDLTQKLKETGWYDRIVKMRFKPWSCRGHIFGVPHDVHPVMLAYRWDLFKEAGIDVNKIETWADFVREGKKLVKDLDGDGTIDRYAIELSESSNSDLEVLLFQRGGGYFDEQGRVIMDNEIAVRTLVDYIKMILGPDRIGSSLGSGTILTKAMEDGYLCSFLTPDWRSGLFKQDVPKVAGKMRLMPLPAWAKGGRRTSTRGGTMIAITKKCKYKELAWELIEFLYLNPKELAKRFKVTNIIPPLREAWSLPEFSEPDPYYSNQPVGKLYASLADDIPPQYTSPYTPMAKVKLSEALINTYQYCRGHGLSNLEPIARQMLKAAADEVRAMVERNVYYRQASK